MRRFRNFGRRRALFLLWGILAVFSYGGDKTALPERAGQMVKVYHAQGHTARVAWFEKRGESWVQVSDEWEATIGRNGLGKTKEGDGKTPVGVYPLGDVFGYDMLATKMPFFKSDRDLICVDDAKSRYYDRIVDRSRVIEDFTSFETMRREDDLYAMVVRVGYNPDHIPGKGSCIFLHVKNGDRPTAGCVGLPKAAMAKLIGWLDPKKRPVVLIERWVPAARFASR